MADPRSIGALMDVFESIDSRVDAIDQGDDPTASELYQYYDRPGGDVDAFGDPEITHLSVQELQGWNDPWPVTYGVDASTTRPLEFSNGLVLGAANAKLGVCGATAEPDLVNTSTIATVAYYADEDFDLSGIDPNYHDVESHLFLFPTLDDRASNLRDWVTGIARTYSEGRHARRLLDRIDGALFIDGPLYPSRVLIWTLFSEVPNVEPAPADLWPEMIHEILTNYVRVVERQARDDQPAIGVVKSPHGTQAVTTLEAKLPDEFETPLRWENDNQFFSEALYTPADVTGDQGAVISYTSWLVQRKMVDKRTQTSIVPFEDLDGVELRRGDVAEYQKAFFYVRVPLKDTILRIEAPMMMVRDEDDREAIQRKVLTEVAGVRDIPFAIQAADGAAGISRENRRRLRGELQSATAVRTYNQRRGYNDLSSTE